MERPIHVDVPRQVRVVVDLSYRVTDAGPAYVRISVLANSYCSGAMDWALVVGNSTADTKIPVVSLTNASETMFGDSCYGEEPDVASTGRIFQSMPPACPNPPGIDPCRCVIDPADPTCRGPMASTASTKLSTAMESSLLASTAALLLTRSATSSALLAAVAGCALVTAQPQGLCEASVVVTLFASAEMVQPTAEECAGRHSVLQRVTWGGGETQIDKLFDRPGTCRFGRPFVTDGAAIMSKATALTGDARAARWASQGLGEHASVASFAAFSLQLMVNGAPFSLLTGAANANADEVRHAEQSFALASRLVGHAITAEPFPRHAISSMQPHSLEKLAEAAFREGCIAETLSVFDAARQVDENDVADDEERNVLIGIVRDEARHSALAWRTVAWATGTAQSAALNERLKQIVVEESERCVAHNCDLFERLIVPLSTKLIGTSDWERVVESEDVDVEIDPSRTLTESTIEALLATFK
jgi:hypothetical protein